MLRQDLEEAFYHTEKTIFPSTNTTLIHISDFSFLHRKAHQSKMCVVVVFCFFFFECSGLGFSFSMLSLKGQIDLSLVFLCAVV